jgi:hypothetical protein
MIGEQYKYYEVSIKSTPVPNGLSLNIEIDLFGTKNVTKNYVYNEIIAVNISPEGNIDWCTRIPKYQHTRDD